MLTFRGDMPPPKHEHGETLPYGKSAGVIMHRRHNGHYWEYGLLCEDYPFIVWVRESYK